MRDFSAFYAAGTIVREGQGNRLYDPAVELRIERERTMRPDQIGFLPYPHAPFEALLFASCRYFRTRRLAGSGGVVMSCWSLPCCIFYGRFCRHWSLTLTWSFSVSGHFIPW